jgi:hypothetical protein
MFLIVHNSLNFNVLPIIKHLLTKIISRNSCYFGFYSYLCNVIEKRLTNNLKIHAMIETLILLGCLCLSIRVTDYVEKQKQNNNNNNNNN